MLWFYRELYHSLHTIGDEDWDSLVENHPEVYELMGHLENLVEWVDKRYDLREPSKNFYKHKDYKDFRKEDNSNLLNFCYDCEETNIDYYMVQKPIWEEFGCGVGLMCIPCLEKRMGRKLQFEDFTKCIVNDECFNVQKLKGN